MNVLHVVPSFYPASVYGGPVQAVHALTRTLARAGCGVRVLTTNANGRATLDVDTRRETLLEESVAVRYCARQLRSSASLPLLRWLASYVHWADVVHLTATYSFPTIPTLLACRLLGRPLVWSPRGGFLRWQGSRRERAKRAWEGVCRLVAPARLVLHATSPAEADACGRSLPAASCVVIPNGVDVPGEVRHAEPNGVLRLLYLGRLDPIKGLENLLSACRLLDESPAMPWTLTVAGGGEQAYVERLARLGDDLGRSRVSFVGEVDAAGKLRAFEAADVLLLPSYSESFGIVAAEALAHGVPVIASHGTPWRQLDAVGCGLWVANSPGALAEAIRRARTLPLRDMGQRGRGWMQERFSWELIAREMLDLYGALAQS
jgi:glycosyltransferase involved in cell wall biosynthesis